jgi:hypothetical protein
MFWHFHGVASKQFSHRTDLAYILHEDPASFSACPAAPPPGAPPRARSGEWERGGGHPRAGRPPPRHTQIRPKDKCKLVRYTHARTHARQAGIQRLAMSPVILTADADGQPKVQQFYSWEESVAHRMRAGRTLELV